MKRIPHALALMACFGLGWGLADAMPESAPEVAAPTFCATDDTVAGDSIGPCQQGPLDWGSHR